MKEKLKGRLKERIKSIHYHGLHGIIDILLFASFVFLCIIYALSLIACVLWAFAIPFVALKHGASYLLWWFPCSACIAILISICYFALTIYDDL